jgi:hypothetical protein
MLLLVFQDSWKFSSRNIVAIFVLEILIATEEWVGNMSRDKRGFLGCKKNFRNFHGIQLFGDRNCIQNLRICSKNSGIVSPKKSYSNLMMEKLERRSVYAL